MKNNRVQELWLATTDQIEERVRERLGKVWNAIYANPELTADLTEIWLDVQTLATVFGSANALLAATIGQLEDMKWQRDIALMTKDAARREGAALARKDLARLLAEATGEAAAAIDRALGILAGESDVWVSDFTKEDFFVALKQLVREAEEEALFVEAALRESSDED